MKNIFYFIKDFDLHMIIIVGFTFCWLNGSIHKIEDRLDIIEKDMAVVKKGVSSMNNSIYNLSENKIPFNHSTGFKPYNDKTIYNNDWMIEQKAQLEN